MFIADDSLFAPQYQIIEVVECPYRPGKLELDGDIREGPLACTARKMRRAVGRGERRAGIEKGVFAILDEV
jgi:hypothetical protein